MLDVGSSNTSSMKKALCNYKGFWKNYEHDILTKLIYFPHRKKILKLFSLGPRYHQEKWKWNKPVFLHVEENHNVKRNEKWGLFYVVLKHWLWRCFPAKRRVLGHLNMLRGRVQWEGGGCKGINLDNSMHLGC